MKNAWAQLLIGDVREQLALIEPGCVQCCVTSPPYWGLRDYGVDGQLGSEPLHDCAGWATGIRCGECFVCHMVEVFEGVKRVLRNDGICFINMGDSYNAGTTARRKPSRQPSNDVGYWLNAGSMGDERVNAPGLKPKDLCGMPWRLALALQAAGWWLRSDIIWWKPNPMPSSVTDRVTTSHEYLFMLAKSSRYFYDAVAIHEKATHAGETVNGSLSIPGPTEKLIAQNAHRGKPYEVIAETRNKRSVWEISTQSFSEAHFATYPEKLVEPCIKAGSSERGCCSKCRAPWRRVVEKERRATRPGEKTKVEGPNSRLHISRDPSHPTESRTVGWEPTCKCEGAESVPCLILDPFTGSGTTGLVARKLGRHFVGTELNSEYAAMAWKRMNAHPKPDLPAVKPVAGQQVLSGF